VEVVLKFRDRELGFVLESKLEDNGIDFSGEFGDAIYDFVLQNNMPVKVINSISKFSREINTIIF
jgi:hypothetical protein